MDFYQRALELQEDLIADRRYFHLNAEAGLCLPKTTAYVLKKLAEYGLDAKRCGEGVTAAVGSGGRVILLRADMDALPMAEESGLPFACPTGTEAHTCGHDLHAAMLLTAARMLKEQESFLKGTVKFMFQPGEETLEGSRNMIEHGILSNPRPEAALALHVGAGKLPVGNFLYNDSGKALMHSTDTFHITIHGKGSHGAYPHLSIDPINIGAHVYLALQELIAREADPSAACILTAGTFHAGSAPNIIPETATLSGTLRTNDPSEQKKLSQRIRAVSEQIAAAYGGSASVALSGSNPAMVCAPELTRRFVEFIQEIPVPNLTAQPGISSSASEDFAQIAQQIPAAMIYLSAGFPDERGNAPAHSPQVRFNEEVLPLGAAVYAHCAARWLEYGR